MKVRDSILVIKSKCSIGPDVEVIRAADKVGCCVIPVIDPGSEIENRLIVRSHAEAFHGLVLDAQVGTGDILTQGGIVLVRQGLAEIVHGLPG